MALNVRLLVDDTELSIVRLFIDGLLGSRGVRVGFVAIGEESLVASVDTLSLFGPKLSSDATELVVESFRSFALTEYLVLSTRLDLIKMMHNIMIISERYDTGYCLKVL